MIGDRRPYLVALVTLDPEEAVAYAAEHDLRRRPGAPSPPTPRSRPRSWPTSTRSTSKFARVEQVKKIEILPHDLSQEGGELTPTLKVKRNVVAEKYAARHRARLVPSYGRGERLSRSSAPVVCSKTRRQAGVSSRSRSTWSRTCLIRRAEISIPWRSAIVR